jgi:predicted transposase YbfD/YdcC
LPQLLNYIQLKYDIAHFFAKKSEKEINSKKINTGNVNKINGIIETYLNALDKALNEFDIESNFGNNAEVIDKWKQKVGNNEN